MLIHMQLILIILVVLLYKAVTNTALANTEPLLLGMMQDLVPMSLWPNFCQQINT